MAGPPPGTPPDPDCYIIPGSLGQLFVAEAYRDDQGAMLSDINWLLISDLDNYTMSFQANDTSLNSKGWIRSLVMERGLTVTATGRLAATDPGQMAVNKAALAVGCDSLLLFRFLIPGAHEGDPDSVDIGFYAWPNRQDTGAASNDAFTWGVELVAFQPPTDLSGGVFPAGAAGSDANQAAGYRGNVRATAEAPAGRRSGTRGSATEEQPKAQAA